MNSLQRPRKSGNENNFDLRSSRLLKKVTFVSKAATFGDFFLLIREEKQRVKMKKICGFGHCMRFSVDSSNL